jgi:hypothetical protein
MVFIRNVLRIVCLVYIFYTRQVSIVKQELLTLPEHMSSPPIFGGVRVTRSLVLCVLFSIRVSIVDTLYLSFELLDGCLWILLSVDVLIPFIRQLSDFEC